MKINPTLPSIWLVYDSELFTFLCLRKRTLNVGKKSFVLWEVGNETLQGSSDHGVLAHENDSVASEGLSDFVHLLRRYIVDADDEDGLVFVEQALQLVKVDCFSAGFTPHDFLRMKLGYLRVNL